MNRECFFCGRTDDRFHIVSGRVTGWRAALARLSGVTPYVSIICRGPQRTQPFMVEIR